MVTTITRNVSDMPPDDRLALEGLLGKPLSRDQQVFIMAYTPGVAPAEAERERARQRIERTLALNQGFAQEQGFTSSEADEAIREAMEQTRRRAACE